MSWNDKKVALDKIKSEDWNDLVSDNASVSSDDCVAYYSLDNSDKDYDLYVEKYTLGLGGATGGTFKLGNVAGTIETAAIDYDADDATIEGALQTAYSDSVAFASEVVTGVAGTFYTMKVTDDSTTGGTGVTLSMTDSELGVKDSNVSTSNTGVAKGYVFNHGVCEGGVDVNSDGIVFDGIDDYIEMDNAIFFNPIEDDWSISLWVDDLSLIGTTHATSTFFNLGWGVDSNDYRIGIGINDSGFITSTSVDIVNSISNSRSVNNNYLGELVHIVLTKSGSTYSIYANGELGTGTSSAATANTVGRNRLVLGSRDGLSYTTNGKMDSVQIYSRALSAGEIEAQYDAGRGAYAVNGDGLVAQYNSRDFTGTEASPVLVLDSNDVVSGALAREARRFDGTNNYIETSSNLLDTNNNTISFWYYANEFESNNGFIGNDNIADRGFSFYMVEISGNKYRLQIRNSDNSGWAIDNMFGSVSVGSWKYITIVQNGSKIDVYENGSNILDTTMSDTQIRVNSQNIYLGRSYYDNSESRYFNGSLDEVGIWSRALTEDEVKAIYNRQKKYFLSDNPAGRNSDFGVKGDLTIKEGQLEVPDLNTAPASASATGTKGEIRFTDDAIYICTDTDTWKKVAVATW